MADKFPAGIIIASYLSKDITDIVFFLQYHYAIDDIIGVGFYSYTVVGKLNAGLLVKGGYAKRLAVIGILSNLCGNA